MLQICLMLPAGGILLYLAVLGFLSLNFGASAISSRVVEFSWAFLALCAGITGLSLAYTGLRWLLYAVWPSPMGITVTDRHVQIALGPFGGHCLDLEEMTAIYRFEREDDEKLSTEDFMDPAEEMETCLPIIRSRRTSGRHPITLNRLLEKYIAGDPHEQLGQLKPLVKLLRNQA